MIIPSPVNWTAETLLPLGRRHPKYVPNTDYPDAGKQYEQAVAPGDIIILASDGVYDNLRPEQLKEVRPGNDSC